MDDSTNPPIALVKRKPGRPKGRKGNGPPDSPGSGRPAKINGEDMLVILRMVENGKTYRQIAEALSTPERTITARNIDRYMARTKTPNETIAQALASLRAQAVDGWSAAIRTGSKYGKHAPSRDLLQATGAIARDEHIDRITIVVGDGTRAVGQLPPILRTIDVIPERAE